jgi:hypothetical protein|tara:strand:- start:9685 stop:10410 length:726 start_codon:yes stop_codon:yes gene_type:complete
MKKYKFIYLFLILINLVNCFILPNNNLNIITNNKLKLHCSNKKIENKIENKKKDIYNNLIYKNEKIPKIIRYYIHNNYSLKDSELKHGRIAILAVIGRISAEILHPKIAYSLYAKNLLVNDKIVPSFINGGLENINPLFYMLIGTYIFIFELNELIEKSDITKVKKNTENLIYDPLNPCNYVSETEKELIKGYELDLGRIAMLLSTFYTYYEYTTNNSIINPELLKLYPYLIGGIFIQVFT